MRVCGCVGVVWAWVSVCVHECDVLFSYLIEFWVEGLMMNCRLLANFAINIRKGAASGMENG